MKSTYSRMQTTIHLIALSAMFIIVGCAAMKGFRTSTEITLEKPPYYHGNVSILNLKNAKIGHLPIILDQRIDRTGTNDLWQKLLDEMNRFLANKKWTSPLHAIELSHDEGPDLFVGYADMFGAPISGTSYTDKEDEKRPPMVLYYKNASTKWKSNLLEIAERQNVDLILFITVGLSEYLVRQKNVSGQKELALGTGYRVPVKWLTSLDDPVEVLHVTGALVDKNGKICRVGAEGILAAKTASFFESVISLRNTLDDESIQKLTSDIRREDLPDKPLNYRVAIQNLVANLLDNDTMIIK